KLTTRRSDLARVTLIGLLMYGALACLFWSGSKSGWLIALVVAMAALLRQPLPKRVRFGILAILLVGGLLGFFVQYSSYFRRGAPSVSSRFDYWKAAVQVGIKHPVFGTGPGTFSAAYRQVKPPEAEMAQLTHNDYLEQASDSGWLGAITYCWFIF